MKCLAGGLIGMVTPVSTNIGSPTPEARDPTSHAHNHMGLEDFPELWILETPVMLSAFAPSVGDQ